MIPITAFLGYVSTFHSKDQLLHFIITFSIYQQVLYLIRVYLNIERDCLFIELLSLGHGQLLRKSSTEDDEHGFVILDEPKRGFEPRTVLSRSLEPRNVEEEEVETKTVKVSHHQTAAVQLMGNFHTHLR